MTDGFLSGLMLLCFKLTVDDPTCTISHLQDYNRDRKLNIQNNDIVTDKSISPVSFSGFYNKNGLPRAAG